MAYRAPGVTAAEGLHFLQHLPEVVALSNTKPSSSIKDVDICRSSREDTQEGSWFPKKPKVRFCLTN